MKVKKILSVFTALAMCSGIYVSPVNAATENPWTDDLAALQGTIAYENVDATFRTDEENFIAAREAGLKSIMFDGLDYEGNETKVFGWYGIPEGASEAEPVPAVVLVHGASSTSYTNWVQHWVDRGYAAIAIDHLGGSGTTGSDMRDLSEDGYAGGPSDAGGLKQALTIDETDKITGVEVEEKDYWNYHAVADTIMANSIIRSMDGVDEDNVGLLGVSWGGYLTLLTSCIDDRFAFAVPNYGCAYIDETSYYTSRRFDAMTDEQHEYWMSKWDPSNYLENIDMPIFMVTGSTDNFFSLNAHKKTYNTLRTLGKDVYLYVENGLDHGIGPAMRIKETDNFADNIVNNADSGFNRLGSVNEYDSLENQAWVKLEKTSPKANSAKLFYTTEFGNWENKTWKETTATVGSSFIIADVPALATAYYFEITDENGNRFTTPYGETDRSMLNLEYTNYFYDNFEAEVADDNYYTNSSATNTTLELVKDLSGAHGSNGAMKITQKDDKGVGLYRDFTFEEGKTYTISAYIKAGENTNLPSDPSRAGQQINIKIGSTNNTVGFGITKDWQKISLEYTSAATETLSVQLFAARDGFRASAGLYEAGVMEPEFYFDDFCISENLPEVSGEGETEAVEEKTYISDSFDTGITKYDWTQKSGATLSHDTTTVGPDGNTGVMKLSQTKTVGACLDLTFEQGKIYEFSVWAKADTDSLANIKTSANFNFYFDEDGTSSGTVLNHRATNANGGAISDSWKQFSYIYKHTQPDITVTTRLYVESTADKTVNMYFDDFVMREVGANIEDGFENSQGVWRMSNSASTAVISDDTAISGKKSLKINTVKDAHMAITKGFAFEADKTYEISAWIKAGSECQLDYPAVSVNNYSYTKTTSGKNDSYEETTLGSKKLKADEAFGANENWQKFTLVYTPTAEELGENYAYSDIRFIADNVKFAANAENNFTYYLDDVSIKEMKSELAGGATITNGVIRYTAENLSGKGYHIMQAVDGVNYVSVKSGIAGSTIGYDGISTADYYITVIDTLAGAAVSTQKIEVNEEQAEKTFKIEFDTDITKASLASGILMNVKNETDVDKSFSAIVAGYDENGALVSCKLTPVAALQGYVTAREISYSDSADSVKVMFINLQTMVPMADSLTAK